MAGFVTRPKPPAWDDTGTNVLADLAGVLKQHFVDPVMGTDDQWALAQFKAQAGDDSMLRALLQNPMAGWATPQPNDEPAPGTPEHKQWFHDQAMNQVMQLTGSGVIAGEGALGAGLIPHGQWYRGADNMRRFEVPDYGSKFDMPGVQQYIDERNKVAPDMHVIGEVGEVLDHPELYKHYPELKNLPVFIAPTVGEHAMHPTNGGQYIRPTDALPQGGIMLNPHEAVRDEHGNMLTDEHGEPHTRPASGDELHAVLMHEINHYIQDKEGFAPGTGVEQVGAQLKNAQAQIDAKITHLRQTAPGHPDIAKLINESDNIDQLLKYDPYHLYSTTAGEVESFNVEDRMNAGKEALSAGVPPDEIARRLGLPTKTQGTPNEKQLVFPSPNRIKLQPVDHTPETAPMPGPNSGPMMVRGFHGTPHDFDEFSNHAIGTGEGAQSFGWGHYFAGNPKVAADYARKLGNPAKPIINKMLDLGDYQEGDDLMGVVDNAIKAGKFTPVETRFLNALKADDWLGFDTPHEAVREAIHNRGGFELSQETKDATDALPKGQTLEVAMKPDEHELLDWDKALHEQHPDIQKILQDKLGAVITDKPGGSFYRELAYKQPGFGHDPNYKAASEQLHSAGIPGLKFLDQGSRGNGGVPVSHVGASWSPTNKIKITGYEPDDKGFKPVAENDFHSWDMIEQKLGKDVASQLKEGLNEKRTMRIPLKQPTDLGTRNYVIFDPSNIKITAKNGKRLIPVDHDPFAEPTK